MAQDRDKQVRDVMDAFKRQPELRFEVARRLGAMRLAGPWAGPTLTTRFGGNPKRTLREWRREDVTGRPLACIAKDEELPHEMSGPMPYDWVAVPDPSAPTDSLEFEHHGRVAELDEAMAAADIELRKLGYILTGGDGLACGPWLRKKNHLCRNMLSGSLRTAGMNAKVAVVREQNELWLWGVLSRESDQHFIARGRADDEHAACEAADEVLLVNGWALGVR